MLKWERKLVEFIDGRLIELAFIGITLIALFMRRDALWHTGFDYEKSFYPETAGYLHTPFYTFFIVLISFIPITPIRTLKWIIIFFDIGTAVGGIFLLKKVMLPSMERLTMFACYALLLLTPLSIENGVTWIHTDSICLCAVIGAVILCQRKHDLWAGILLGIAAALQMQYIIFFVAAGIYGGIKNRKILPGLGIGLGVVAALTVIGCLRTGIDVRDSFSMLFNWLAVSPVTGELFNGILPWLDGMLRNFAYLIGMGAILFGFCKPKYWWAAAGVHMGIVLYIGQILQQNI